MGNAADINPKSNPATDVLGAVFGVVANQGAIASQPLGQLVCRGLNPIGIKRGCFQTLGKGAGIRQGHARGDAQALRGLIDAVYNHHLALLFNQGACFPLSRARDHGSKARHIEAQNSPG